MNILDTIVAQKKREVTLLPGGEPTVAELREAVARRGGARDFTAALRRPSRGSVGLIAEIKKASPSVGVIRPDFDPVTIARAYEQSGAACLSVLTDEKFFQGALSFLRDVRAAVKVPLLRKDFIVDARQIREAIEWGADAILLIVSILTDSEMQQLHALARGAGLAVLVETHDESELDRAVALGAELIGVNNRNLDTFKVDLATTERLSARLRETEAARCYEPLLVAESGIYTPADVERLARCGARAILVGESLVRQPDVGAATRALLAGMPADNSEG
jgi:indole-3-glycerol phosphate synthase